MEFKMEKFKLAGLDEVLWAQKSSGPVILDTLPPEHFEARHIPGASNACVYEVTFLDQAASLLPDRDTPVIVYGAGEGSLDSREAAAKLIRAGYTDVACFPGGLQAWREAGRPLEGSRPNKEDPPHPVLALEPRAYAVLPEESRIVWFGRNINGGHTGTLGAREGWLEVAESGLRGSLTLDMKSIRNLDLEGNELQPVLEAHLKSDDFFFVQLFPRAEFELLEMAPIPEAPATMPNYRARGRLTVRDVSQEIDVAVSLRPLPQGRLSLMANFDLDRTRWHVIYGSARFFKHLSYHLVFDLISLDVRLVLG
jgi:rhodanese-related sulfurtransferase